MSENSPDFISWREQFVSQERGSRVVHYFLEDSRGESHLAVVGTERSLRHMLYVASEEFCRDFVADKSGVASFKWRSRREVVDWLTSFLQTNLCSRKLASCSLTHTPGAEIELNTITDHGLYRCKNMDEVLTSDITWSGFSWTCGKQLRHFEEFCRNGVKITIHSFVLVLSEEENRYLAYLEDMYEDKKGLKKVKVRWFHQDQEFTCAIPPPTPHPNEVFITPYSQVISAECVDEIATVLTPDHYEKCLASVSSSAGIRLCFRQFSKNKFKLFDLRTLRGYFSQAVLSLVNICAVPGKGEEHSDSDGMIKQFGSKRIRFVKGHRRFLSDHLGTKISGHTGQIPSLQPAYKKLRYGLAARNCQLKFHGPLGWFTQQFKVGDKVELLCQDSGIRGCWFKCTVLQVSNERLKVQYDDVQNVDGCGNLEEWISVNKLAAPDKLGMRYKGRLTVRPCPSFISLLDNVDLQNGMAVDAHWNDGWWEGVVVEAGSSEENKIHVYLSGEDIFVTCERKNLRISKDWVDNRWLSINAKPEILSARSSVSPTMKFTGCSAFNKGTSPVCSAMSGQQITATVVDSSREEKLVDDRSCKMSVELGVIVEGKAINQQTEEGTSGCDVDMGTVGDAVEC